MYILDNARDYAKKIRRGDSGYDVDCYVRWAERTLCRRLFGTSTVEFTFVNESLEAIVADPRRIDAVICGLTRRYGPDHAWSIATICQGVAIVARSAPWVLGVSIIGGQHECRVLGDGARDERTHPPGHGDERINNEEPR